MTGKGKALGTLSSNGSEHPPAPHPNSSSLKRDHKTIYIQEHLCLDCGRSASTRPLLCKGSLAETAEKHRLNPEPSTQSGSRRVTGKNTHKVQTSDLIKWKVKSCLVWPHMPTLRTQKTARRWEPVEVSAECGQLH